jgi:glycine hydroxymethyltransferase
MSNLKRLLQTGIKALRKEDYLLYRLLEDDQKRQEDTLMMVAASSVADPSVLACSGSEISNLTTEGFPGARFHAGCKYADEIENLAISRAKKIFGAQYVNVQPHSGTSANLSILFGLLNPGDTILGLELSCGGHLTHGSKASITSKYFNAVHYELDTNGLIDYDQVLKIAKQHKPKLIICGASAYPRIIDFAAFRRIADEVKAYLLADISHISGLVVAGEHPSPIDHAHFTTSSTYKQLFGPRGGIILMGKDYNLICPNKKRPLAELVQAAVFPQTQGTPSLASIAAKARAFAKLAEPEFVDLAKKIISQARQLSDLFIKNGYKVLTNGTDNHMILIDILSSKKITGVVAEKALEECNIIINKNFIAHDKKTPFITSGIRIGTNSLAARNLGDKEVILCFELINKVLSSIQVLSDCDYILPEDIKNAVKKQVKRLCKSFKLPRY